MEEFDVAIIGAGPGGYAAALRAAQLGLKVALIEKSLLGGTCLNEGCIPTKFLILCAKKYYEMKDCSKFGISVEGNISIDLKKIQKEKNTLINNLRNGLSTLIKLNKITIFNAEAKFKNNTTLTLKEEEIKAKKIIIATGTSVINDFNDIKIDDKNIFSSQSILNLQKLPDSIAIIGGGYIGCEFATFFNMLGVKVSIIELTNSILMKEEESIKKEIKKAFERKNIEILSNEKVVSIDKQENTVVIKLDSGKTITKQIALMTIGRKPNINNLNLEAIGIEIEKNYIKTNEYNQTNVDNIYAIGDVAGKFFFAHSAFHEGMIVASNLQKNTNKEKITDIVPSVVFTSPEIASVGMSTQKAIDKKIDFAKEVFPFKALGASHITSKTEGFIHMLIEKETKKILGVHIIGDNASHLIAEMTLAITNGLTLNDINKTMHVHPTLSESLAELCFLADDFPLHFYKAK